MSKYRDKEKFKYNSHFISGETMCLQVKWYLGILYMPSIELLLLSLSNSKNLNFQMTQSKRHAN